MSQSTIFPLSTKDSYRQNDIIDWLLAFEDKAIVQNSIRITGNVRVVKSADFGDATKRVAADDKVQIDSVVGIAGAFQSITCSTDLQGVIENQNEHGRYVKAKSVSQTTEQHRFTDTRNITELKAARDVHTRYLLASNSSSADASVPFSWKPDCAFNRTSANISHKKTGGLKLSVRLATDQQFLYGDEASSFTYELTDLRLEYNSVPDKGAGGNLSFATINMVKNTAESNNTNISTRVPAIVQSCSIVFHKDSQLNQATYNHYQLEEPPNIQRVTFSWNDSLSTYYNFPLETKQEILYNYQMSWGAMGKSDLGFVQLNSNENYGVGMPFGTFYDMSKGSKFGVNILSDIDATIKYAVFLFFRGIVQI